MNKRYQVFVSSTYADLQEERSKVIQTIMELDCIPAGMEIFPAIDQEQFDFIKSVIDDCDYYILIIGGRYGSVSEDGISYTEKEYNYAKEKGIRIIAFIHSNPELIPFGKTEKDSDLRRKLEEFKNLVSSGRLVKFWNNTTDLPGLVSLSLSKTIKTYPAVGWIRATTTSNAELLAELNDQRKENQELRRRIEEYEKLETKELKFENIAGFEDKIHVNGTTGYSEWSLDISWKEIFYIISPFLLEQPTDEKALETLSQQLFEKTGASGYAGRINSQTFQTIKIQLQALQLISVEYSKTTTGGRHLFWGLTEKGKEQMFQLRVVTKNI